MILDNNMPTLESVNVSDKGSTCFGGWRLGRAATVALYDSGRHRSESGGGSGDQVVRIKNKLLHAIDLYHLRAYLSYNGSIGTNCSVSNSTAAPVSVPTFLIVLLHRAVEENMKSNEALSQFISNSSSFITYFRSRTVMRKEGLLPASSHNLERSTLEIIRNEPQDRLQQAHSGM